MRLTGGAGRRNAAGRNTAGRNTAGRNAAGRNTEGRASGRGHAQRPDLRRHPDGGSAAELVGKERRCKGQGAIVIAEEPPPQPPLPLNDHLILLQVQFIRGARHTREWEAMTIARRRLGVALGAWL